MISNTKRHSVIACATATGPTWINCFATVASAVTGQDHAAGVEGARAGLAGRRHFNAGRVKLRQINFSATRRLTPLEYLDRIDPAFINTKGRIYFLCRPTPAQDNSEISLKQQLLSAQYRDLIHDR
jgi:hypothetical protein